MAVTTPTLPTLGPPATGPCTTPSGTERRLLVVDDDPGALEALAAVLRAAGASVETCSDANRALERIEEAQFDLVIADQRMPRVRGLELLRRVRALSPRTPTILVSGHLEPDLLEDAYGRCGVFRTLAKPWNVQDLVRTAADALRCLDLLDGRADAA